MALAIGSYLIWDAQRRQTQLPRIPDPPRTLDADAGDASSARYEDAGASAPLAPGAYLSPPAMVHFPPHEGHYWTEVRFRKSVGPWEAQESRFDLWFDGDVEQEFQSRGFEDPVRFEVKVPEPRHIAIRVTTAPWSQAAYVSFEFKSDRRVSLVRSEVSPMRDDPTQVDR